MHQMIASGLIGKLWASAISYAADISDNISETDYILWLTDNSVESMLIIFKSSYVHAQNAEWSSKNAELMN